MPKNVRNYWVEARVDDRDTIPGFGPKAKSGGMEIALKMRENGQVVTVGYVVFRANGEQLTMDVEIQGSSTGVQELPGFPEGSRHLVVRTQR